MQNNKDIIECNKVNYLFENLLSGLGAIFLLSLIIFFSFYNLVDDTNLWIWITLNTITLLMRWQLHRTYISDKFRCENIDKHYKMFFLLSSINALIWGMSAFFILPEDIQYQTVILMLIAGLLSGAAITLSSKAEMFYAYLSFIILPYIYVFLNMDNNSSRISAIAMIIYFFLLLILSRKSATSVHNNILYAYQNQELVEKLKTKVEEVEVANKAKSDFLSVMSHEIRTPLNAIVGFVQVMLKDETDKKKLKYLQTIDNSSKVLTNVINDILDITKIESGKFSLEMVSFSTYDELNTIYNLFEQNAKEKDIKLINSISTKLPVSLKTDILRLKQIISNLLSNAIKFTPKDGEVELKIEFIEDKSSLYVEVRDSGIGISKDNIENITKAFTQADSSTARKYGGTGLGLSIVTSLLKLFGSELKIESELAKGSIFSFVLAVEAISKEEKNITIDEDEISFSGVSVLVAEDNKTNQMLIDIVLDDMEIEVTIANDGVEALKAAQEHRYDMILMDINMPNKNGIEAMQEIKEYEKSQDLDSLTPIIALTANAVSGDKEKYIKMGFDGYLAKPLEVDELVSVLKQI